MPPRRNQISRIITRLALGIGLAVAISLPLVNLITSFSAASNALEFKARVKATALSGLIASTPDLWMYAETRIQGLISREPVPLDNEQVKVFDEKDDLVMQYGDLPHAPVLSKSYPLYDSNRVVGQLEVTGSLLGNSVATVSFGELSNTLHVLSNVVISVYEDAPLDFLMEDYAINCPFAYAIDEQPDLAPFEQSVYADDRPAVHAWLDGLGLLQRPMETFALLSQLNCAIANHFAYQIREEEGVQSPAKTLGMNSGSCRDFAALFIEACRYMGLASRFVSGYLHMPDNETGNATTHAWLKSICPVRAGKVSIRPAA